MSDQTRILIVGAGLAGSLLACDLGAAGFSVAVYERRPDPRAAGFHGGRSINLALSTRGIHALEQVNLARQVLEDAIPMRGRMMHYINHQRAFQPYSKDPNDAINSVSRSGLNITLLNACEQYDHVQLYFQHKCLDVNLERPSVDFTNEQTGETLTVNADVVIGADGAFSAIRSRLQRTDRFNYAQQFLAHGYKELSIPPTDAGAFAMEPNALHIWPHGGSMMIALPNKDRSFTCTCFWPFEGEHSFAAIQSADDVKPFFEKYYPDAVPLMPTLVDDFMNNPTSSLVTIRCEPWHYEDKVLLIGDAAHAIVPFYGQGMNCAFEDCTILMDMIRSHQHDDAIKWRDVLSTFSAKRKDDADAIADLALDNFIEMRDKVGSKAFLMKKRLEHVLHRLFPETFKPLYNMVTFSRIPYADARRRAQRQWRAIIAGFATGVALIALIVTILVTG